MGAESRAFQRKGSGIREAWVPESAQGHLSVGAQNCRGGEDTVKVSSGLWGQPRDRQGVEVAGGSVDTSPAVHCHPRTS